MEDLLARERAAEDNVHQLLNPDYSIDSLLQALDTCRQLCQECVLKNILAADHFESRLWAVHTEAKKYLHLVLGSFRKQGEQKLVATRQVIKDYSKFIKQSQTFYRGYIVALNSRFGGIPELETVAQHVKHASPDKELRETVTPELSAVLLDSCHRSLIYLGDLSRYRASEKLDKKPDFGPAIGYYGLACALCPSSGMGHHQQAVIALEQKNHFRAIYHLYRALVTANPHPNAAANLRVEFDKVNSAWDRGVLIEKGSPNDANAPKRAVIGWFVRLHSMCYRGEPFRGHDELERELLAQLASFLKHESASSVLNRMVIANMAAQAFCAERFQESSTTQNQQAFFYFFRFNMKMLTLLSDALYKDIVPEGDERTTDWFEQPLESRLHDVARALLPSLRMYSSWLLSVAHLLAGLATDDFLQPAIQGLWHSYARTIDLIATAFPIWDLEDIPEADYMFEEDSDTIGFSPLNHEQSLRTWYDSETGAVKARLSDVGVSRISLDDETLTRVKDVLVDGLYLANDSESSPLSLRGTRILYGPQEFALPAALQRKDPEPGTVPLGTTKTSKPIMSYAAAAASAKKKTRGFVAAPSAAPSLVSSRQDQLSRMVDDLVEDDSPLHPATPPRRLPGSPGAHPGPDAFNVEPHPSVSSLWRNDPSTRSRGNVSQQGPEAAKNLLSPPIYTPGRGHSRDESVSSIRSSVSAVGEALAYGEVAVPSQQLAPPSDMGTVGGMGQNYPKFSESGMGSPLLFGAGGGLWSPAGQTSWVGRTMSPAGGQSDE